MRSMVSLITGVSIVCWSVGSGANQRITTSKLRVTGLCAGNSPVTGEFPAQKASNAENVSIWWRHRVSPIQVCTALLEQKDDGHPSVTLQLPCHVTSPPTTPPEVPYPTPTANHRPAHIPTWNAWLILWSATFQSWSTFHTSRITNLTFMAGSIYLKRWQERI